ncbi:SxtJ family membrane protein [Prochlorococcus sp. MIT 1341]|uniref:SxtJ family membrane protein n=1 Tax=Prochlorococcus sp. MIT 1341 TaxID=3096221 RepID=UPI002A75008B|nr:SxtJ family membrane protein [Prochlorococcus sp. MIT 1341]
MQHSISTKKLREFGILIGLAFPIFIGWILPTIGGHSFRAWTLLIGIPALILGLLKPSLLNTPYKGWMALGHALGWVNSRIILGIVFLAVLQPIAFAMRLLGYDPLRKKINNEYSYREVRKNHKIDLTRIF